MKIFRLLKPKFLLFSFLLSTTALMFGCKDDNNDGGGTEPNTPDLTLVSADYYGDDNDDGIAKYVVAISVDDDKEQVADIFLTFFSKVVLDAEYALPEAGKYTVAYEKGSSTVLAGKSKVSDNKYEGSYVVSIINEAVRESKIIGGSVEVSYQNNNCILKVDLEDELGLLDKYNDVKLTYNGPLSFANKAIAYYIFKAPGNDYNRCWYFGEPSGRRESDDGTELGEYLFVFSNAKSGEVEKKGQVVVSFYLMNEYQLYGLDRKINAGVYPVNLDGFKGKLGTIFLYDITDQYAPYSGTVKVKVFEKDNPEEHLVVDGWLAIFEDDKGVPNRFVVNFTREDGVKFHGRYDSELSIGDEWTLSDFREDINIAPEQLPGAYMRIIDPGYRYEQAGSNQWELYLLGEGVSVSPDEDGYMTIHGPGDCFRFDISTNASAEDAIPAGIYEIQNSYEPGIAQQGNKTIGYIGIYKGAWFHRITGGNTDILNTMGLSGTLTISKDGDRYTIEAIFHDDAKNTISGKYIGIPTIEDHRTTVKSGMVDGGTVRLKVKAVSGKYLSESSIYWSARKEKAENAGTQLK